MFGINIQGYIMKGRRKDLRYFTEFILNF